MQKQRVTKSLYFYTPKRYENDIAFQITFRALSHKELDALLNFSDTDDNNKLFSYQVCKIAIIEIEDDCGNICEMSALAPDVFQETAEYILDVSGVTKDEVDKLLLNINISFSNTFKSDSWECENCRHKKLDRIRNCGYLGDTFQNNDFSIRVGEQVYTECPIYFIDANLLDMAIECYSLYDKNCLPDAGGLYDQTRFFVTSSKIISQKIKAEEAKELKRQKNKSKG